MPHRSILRCERIDEVSFMAAMIDGGVVRTPDLEPLYCPLDVYRLLSR